MNCYIGRKARKLPTMDYEAFRRFLITDRKLTGSTPAKTIRNIKYLERNNALTSTAFREFTFQFLEAGKVPWYNKLIQAITHYWAWIGDETEPPPQHTPTDKPPELYPSDAIVSVLKVAKSPYRECLQLLANIGGRPSEIRLLTASQLNFELNCVTLKATKTHAERNVPIPDAIRADLYKFAKNKTGRLFNFSDTMLNKKLRHYCTLANVTYHPPKCFRNGFVTRLANADAPLFAVMGLVGHKRPKTTMRYYVQSLDILRKTIERDTLGFDQMSDEKKLKLYKKYLRELQERLHLDTFFDVRNVDTPDGIEHSVKLRPKTATNPTQSSDDTSPEKK